MSVARTQALPRAPLREQSPGSSPAKRGSPAAQLLRAASRCYNFFRLSSHPSHKRTVRAAARALKTVRSFRGEAVGARVFGYLRKVDPNVFEEMVLTALQDGGRLVRRNLRYTGDGGSDGSFYEPGVGWLQVQSKRYGSHISAEHVRDFSGLIKSSGCVGGVFVHTGKTGAGAWLPASGEVSRVVMVSGNGLLGLLLRGELP
jgi:restriction system protein